MLKQVEEYIQLSLCIRELSVQMACPTLSVWALVSCVVTLCQEERGLWSGSAACCNVGLYQTVGNCDEATYALRCLIDLSGLTTSSGDEGE
jgi:hypothetical protein